MSVPAAVSVGTVPPAHLMPDHHVTVAEPPLVSSRMKLDTLPAAATLLTDRELIARRCISKITVGASRIELTHRGQTKIPASRCRVGQVGQVVRPQYCRCVDLCIHERRGG